MRCDFRDHLPVGAQHQPQSTVRAGMLRTHVDQHLIGADVELDDGGVLLNGCGGAHATNLSKVLHRAIVLHE